MILISQSGQEIPEEITNHYFPMDKVETDEKKIKNIIVGNGLTAINKDYDTMKSKT